MEPAEKIRLVPVTAYGYEGFKPIRSCPMGDQQSCISSSGSSMCAGFDGIVDSDDSLSCRCSWIQTGEPERVGEILERELPKRIVSAIPTEYRGVKYRSRLEARWAVFLDHLGVEHYYEYEGFELECGRYLPDFWLPGVKDGCWLEIKPERPKWDSVEIRKCEQLADATRKAVLLAHGMPADPYTRDHLLVFYADGAGDESWGFCECPTCHKIGTAYLSWADRICGGRCCGESTKLTGWTDRLEQASREAMRASFWNPR